MSGSTIQRVSAGANILQPFSPQALAQSAAASEQIRSIGRRFRQQIYQTTVTPVYGSPTVINVPVQPIGLVTKFIVELSTVVTNPNTGSLLTRTGMGPFNQLSLIQYTDPATNTRISTPGWHLAAVTARRHRRVPGAAVTTDSPSGFGAVISPIACPSTIAANANGTVRAVYEVPLSIGRHSLRGAVFSGAVFATQSLQLTVNPNLAQNSTDPLLAAGGAVFTGASNANPPTFSTTVTVIQEYWDQFPLQLLAPLAPDLSTVYEIKQTSFSPLVANADNYIRFTNLREFWSVTAAYDNGGTLNAGSDINYFMLQSANQTTEWKFDAFVQSYLTRNAFGDDFPAGHYMFDLTEAPIVTAAEGNTVLSVNPSSVNANAVLYVGWEDLAISSVLASAPSLSGNAGSSG